LQIKEGAWEIPLQQTQKSSATAKKN